MNDSEFIEIIKAKINECEADYYKLLKIALVELKQIDMYKTKPIVEKPTFRIKSTKSIYRKILNKEYINIENFTNEMKDILGIRVICRNLSSLENVYEALLRSNDIKFLKNMEKRWIEESDDGYRGIHLVFTAKDGILFNSELKGEIQLRTIAQHYWAIFSHHDIYKEQPTLSYSENLRIRSLSDYLYLIDKELDSLGFDIKADPFAINLKTLHSLFEKLGKQISYKDTEVFFDMISGNREKVNGNLKTDIFGNKNILSINEAIVSAKNEMGVDLSGIGEWTDILYNLIFKRDATDTEIIFCRLYAYFKGFYWPKRRLFEYVLSLKNEQWGNLIGNNLPENLVSLLEAAIYESIDRHSYYYSNFEDRENEPYFSKYTDSNLLSNRGIEVLSKNDLLTVKLDSKVRVYPDKKELVHSVDYDQILKIYPDFLNFSYKKDTYHIKCTSKGKKVSFEIIRKLFYESSFLKPILDGLEIEDFPYPDFPYENPTSWGFPVYSVEFSQSNKEEIEKGLNFNKNDWWTREPGYF